MNGPVPERQIQRTPSEELIVEGVCKRPGMYVRPSTIDSVISWIDGYDAGQNGAPLLGFREWLIVRNKGGTNLHWSSLAMEALGPAADDTTKAANILALGKLFEEFFAYRYENEIVKVFNDYARWLLKHSWYDGPLREKGRKSKQKRRTSRRK